VFGTCLDDIVRPCLKKSKRKRKQGRRMGREGRGRKKEGRKGRQIRIVDCIM
jgi:hypothetical protein